MVCAYYHVCLYVHYMCVHYNLCKISTPAIPKTLMCCCKCVCVYFLQTVNIKMKIITATTADNSMLPVYMDL